MSEYPTAKIPYTPPAARPVTITWTTRLTAGHYSGERSPLNLPRDLPTSSHMRFEIGRARTPNQNMGGRGTGRMRIGLAAFGAVLIGGISVGLVVLGSTDSTSSAQHVRRAVAAGAPAAQTTSRSGSDSVPAVQ